MLRALAFIAMRKEQDNAALTAPLLLSCKKESSETTKMTRKDEPALMNWSMMHCAVLAKSPNWASHKTESESHKTRMNIRH